MAVISPQLLEERLGYHFKNGALLARALTTPACKMDHPGVKDNQRLEFLGDAVLGLLTAHAIYNAFPEEQEGPLTVRRTHVVSGVALSDVAERIGLREFLRTNAGAAAIPPHAKVLTDAVEAILGAAWLDGGLDAAQCVFKSLHISIDADLNEWAENPKGRLQILTQAMHPPRKPVYTVLARKGPAHAPQLTVCVRVSDVGEAIGKGSSMRAAEAAAATALLKNVECKNEE